MFSLRVSDLDSRTSPWKRFDRDLRPRYCCLSLATSASVRPVKTASARRWKVAFVCLSTVGWSTVEAPALQLGTRATPATTEAAAAVNMVARRRLWLNFLDFTEFPLCPALGRRGLE